VKNLLLHRSFRTFCRLLLAVVLAPLLLAPSALAADPQVTGILPADGATNVLRDSGVTAEVILATPGHGVAAASLEAGVSLKRTSDGAVVPTNVNTSAGGDVVSLTPKALLASNTQYTFSVTAALKDTNGASFAPASSSFTTGTGTGAVSTDVRFTKTPLTNTERVAAFTSAVVGPDRRLYVSTMTGEIYRYPINSNGTLGTPLVINSIVASESAERHVLGLAIQPGTGTADTPAVLWVTHGQGVPEDADNWTSKITRLTGTNLTNATDMVVGLPRSVRDHETNSLAFGPDGGLYVNQGSQSAMGEADDRWLRDETLLSGAVLRVNWGPLGQRSTPLDVKTEGPSAYDPYANGALVTLYATGIRNAYDLVWHTNGQLYLPTNGSAAGGNMPARPTTPPAQCANRLAGPPSGNFASFPQLTSMPAQTDWLHRVHEGKYYGHPNPSRCEYVAYGGDPTNGDDPWEVLGYNDSRRYPLGTAPEPNWEAPAADLGLHASANGLVEYRGDQWGGQLKGALLIARYSQFDDLLAVTLNANGTVKQKLTGIPGLTGFSDPLDVAQDPTNNNLYVIELPYVPADPESSNPRIVLVRPVSTPTPTPTQPPATPLPTATPAPSATPVPTSSPKPGASPTPGPGQNAQNGGAPAFFFGTRPVRAGSRSLKFSCRLGADALPNYRCRIQIVLGKNGRQIFLKRSKFTDRSAKVIAPLSVSDLRRARKFGVTVRITLIGNDGKTRLTSTSSFLSQKALR
jgi:glucose/arabinose dehydrogenase